jgi:hypothetical protein
MNYYFKIKKSKEIKDKIRQLLKKEDIYHLIDFIPEDDIWAFREKINIGSTKYGYKPLFCKTVHYSSVKEIIKFYNDNKDELIIIDECNNEIPFNELMKIMTDKTDSKSNVDYKKESFISNDLFSRTIYTDDEGYEFESSECI